MQVYTAAVTAQLTLEADFRTPALSSSSQLQYLLNKLSFQTFLSSISLALTVKGQGKKWSTFISLMQPINALLIKKLHQTKFFKLWQVSYPKKYENSSQAQRSRENISNIHHFITLMHSRLHDFWSVLWVFAQRDRHTNRHKQNTETCKNSRTQHHSNFARRERERQTDRHTDRRNIIAPARDSSTISPTDQCSWQWWICNRSVHRTIHRTPGHITT